MTSESKLVLSSFVFPCDPGIVWQGDRGFVHTSTPGYRDLGLVIQILNTFKKKKKNSNILIFLM